MESDSVNGDSPERPAYALEVPQNLLELMNELGSSDAICKSLVHAHHAIQG